MGTPFWIPAFTGMTADHGRERERLGQAAVLDSRFHGNDGLERGRGRPSRFGRRQRMQRWGRVSGTGSEGPSANSPEVPWRIRLSIGVVGIQRSGGRPRFVVPRPHQIRGITRIKWETVDMNRSRDCPCLISGSTHVVK